MWGGTLGKPRVQIVETVGHSSKTVQRPYRDRTETVVKRGTLTETVLL